jgi:hypothetical protein
VKPVTAALAALLFLPVAAAEWSDGTMVFLRPDETPIWRTATNANMRLEWMMPKGAESADLTVSGLGYAKTYPDITTGYIEISLPAPVDALTENVYDFTLEFDNKETLSAKLGVVRGAGKGNEFIGTPCVVSEPYTEWIRSRAVLPVPYGAELTLNGEIADTGLDGAAGWYVWGPLSAESVAGGAKLTVDGADYEANLRWRMSGFHLIVK